MKMCFQNVEDVNATSVRRDIVLYEENWNILYLADRRSPFSGITKLIDREGTINFKERASLETKSGTVQVVPP